MFIFYTSLPNKTRCLRNSIRKRGFTLIELLVVVTILAVLSALMLSALSSTTSQAASAQSLSNLRQISLAMHQYAGENQGAFPPTASQVSNAQGSWALLGSWDSFLFPYLGLESDPHVTSNPKLVADQKAMDIFQHTRDESVITEQAYGGFRRSYGMPYGDGKIGVTVWGGNTPIYSARLGSIPDPARTILVTEKAGYDNNYVSRTGFSGVFNVSQQVAMQPVLNRGGKFHYLFADGHIELLDPAETIGSGSVSAPKGMWTIDPSD